MEEKSQFDPPKHFGDILDNHLARMTSEATSSSTREGDNQLYQFSVVNALMAGYAEGGLPVSKFLEKGNIGLGTFDGLQGELVILDRIAYRLTSEGSVTSVSSNEKLPYALVANFVSQKDWKSSVLDRKSLETYLRKRAKNHFLIFKIEAHFDTMSCRTVSGQRYKGESLTKLSKDASKKTFTNMKGSIVGIFTPHVWEGISVAGQHMHFIDENRLAGGHILDFQAKDAIIQEATSSNIQVELPKTGSAFDEVDLDADRAALRQAEGSTS